MPFFDGIVPGIIGTALIFPVTRENLILGLLLGTIPRSYMIVSALVCIPLTVKPLIKLFEVVCILVRVLDKADLFDTILVTSVSARSVVAILVTADTTVVAFGDIFEGLYFIVNYYVNRGHVHLMNYFLFIRGLAILLCDPLIVIEDMRIFMSSPGAHDFISELIALVYLFKCGAGQILDNLHGFFDIVQCPQYKLLLRSSLEVLEMPTNKL